MLYKEVVTSTHDNIVVSIDFTSIRHGKHSIGFKEMSYGSDMQIHLTITQAVSVKFYVTYYEIVWSSPGAFQVEDFNVMQAVRKSPNLETFSVPE